MIHKEIDEIFLQKPKSVTIVDPLDFINEIRVSEQEKRISQIENVVRDVCVEMWKIPGVHTWYSCVGWMVHKEWGEWRYSKDSPHIIFSNTDNHLRIDEKTLENFAGSYPHHEFYKYLNKRFVDEEIPFDFTWYHSAGHGKPISKAPIMAAPNTLDAKDVLIFWDKIISITKEFQNMYDYHEISYSTIHRLKGKVSEEEVMAFFPEPEIYVHTSAIARKLGTYGNDVQYIIDKLVEQKKLFKKEEYDPYCLFLKEEQLNKIKERKLW